MESSPTLMEIIDTAVKIGLGALISFLTTYYLANKTYKRKLKEEADKRKRQNIITPIIDYIDKLLSFASKVLLFDIDGTLKGSDAKNYNQIMVERLSILARVKTLANENIITVFNEFLDESMILVIEYKKMETKEKLILNESIVEGSVQNSV